MVTSHHFPSQILSQRVEDADTVDPIAAVSESDHLERPEKLDAPVSTEESARVHRCTISTSPSPAKTSCGKSGRKIHMDVRLVVRVSSEGMERVTKRAKSLKMDRSKYVRYLIEHALKSVPEGVLPTDGPTDQEMNPTADQLLAAPPSSKRKKTRLQSGYSPESPGIAWVGKDVDPTTVYPPGFDVAVFYSALNMAMVRCRNLLAENVREVGRLRFAMEPSSTRQQGGFSTVPPSLEALDAIKVRLYAVECILHDAMRTARGELPVLLDPDLLVEFGQQPEELAPEMADCLRRRMEAMPEQQRSRLDPDRRGFFFPQDRNTPASSDGGGASWI